MVTMSTNQASRFQTILKWMFQRVNNEVAGEKTALGIVPKYSEIDWSGLNFSEAQFNKVTSLDSKEWEAELQSHKEFFLQLDHLPTDFINQQERTLVQFLGKPAPNMNQNSTSLN